MVLRTASACSASSGLMAVSSFVIISVAGMLVGVTATFSPLLNRVVSASLSVLENRVMTQFVWSMSRLTGWLLSVRGEASRKLFLSLFSVVKDSLVLVQIWSSRVLASSTGRVDLILISLDSASFFVSGMALLVSRIRSLRNRKDVSSAAFRAPLAGIGRRTRRYLGMMVRKESESGNSQKTQPKQHKQGQRSRNTGSVDAYNKKTSKPTTHEKSANA